MSLSGTVLEICLLLLVVVAVALTTRHRRLPLSVALVVAGFVLSSAGAGGELAQLEGEAFEQVVVLLLLPALVFAAALELDLRALLRNLGAVVALAVLAFAASAALVGIALSALLGLPLVVALLFGALISATDPVAVVAVFRDVGVPRRLLVLMEGESLLNDGVAIVLTSVLLGAATGMAAGPVEGALLFVQVFFGGALIGLVLGAVAALALPWLEPLPAVVLSLAVAYGGFVLAEEVLGFSGVMATATAGLVLSGLSPSRAPEVTRAAWRSTWGTLEYVVNGLLFLLIGLTLGVTALVEHLPAIALAVAVVLVARALAVVPVVFLLERVSSVPRVGRRNEAVLVWGGLRGGVALALALALPEDLADRELLVSLTGGVVLATLLLNATTIQTLVHRLGLDRPSGAERFLTALSHLAALTAARQRLDELGLGPDAAALDRSLQEARAALADLELDDDEQVRAVVSRGLQVERTTYQLLSDAGMLPPPVARVLLHEVDDEVEELTAMGPRHRLGEHARGHRRDVVVKRLLERLPGPAGQDREHDDHAEATARRLAARRTVEALVLFDELPVITPETVRRAREVFERWEGEAQARLESLDSGDPATTARLRAQQAAVVGQLEGARALRELVDTGVLPERAGDGAN